MIGGLAFFGKIAASLSHELNNAIAIINEHSGLVDDLAEAIRQGMAADDKKLKMTAKKIAGQVERSKELIKRLNRFAHAADEPVKQCDLNDLVTDITDLSRRLADLKGMQLQFDGAGGKIMLASSPFFIQQAVFIALELFLEEAKKNRLIALTCGKDESSAWIKLTGSSIYSGDDAQSKRDYLALLLEQLHGTVEYLRPDAQNVSILLKITL
jgi:phosphoglycerate-specific signal transduction histidine kinase